MQEQICGLSTIEIDQLKAKHGILIEAIVKQGETEYKALFKEPNFAILEATGAISEKQAIKGTVALYDNCMVAQDEAFTQRDFLKLKAVECLALHMNSFSLSVKNL